MRQAQMSEVSCLHRVSFPNNGGGEVMVTIIFITSIVIVLWSSWGLVLLPPKTGPTLGISSLQEAMTKVPQMTTPPHIGLQGTPLCKQDSSQHKNRHHKIQLCPLGKGGAGNGKWVTQDTRGHISAAVPRGLLTGGPQIKLAGGSSGGCPTPLCPVPYHLTHLSAAVPVTLGCFHLPYGNPGGVPPGPASIMWQQTKVYFAPFLFTWQGPITPNLQFQNL